MTITRKMLITRGAIHRYEAEYYDLLRNAPAGDFEAQAERIVVLGYIGGLRKLYASLLRKLRKS